MNTIKKINAKHLLLFTLFCIPFILFLNLQNASVVTVHADYPTHVVAGTTFPITVTIEKGNLNGFGRFTSTLPEGFTATCDLQNFEFSENTIKILWVNIPYANSFTFTINITIPETYSGTFMLNGKFGYVINNERHFAELIPDNITVVNDPIAMRKALAEQNALNAPVNLQEISCYRSVNIVNNEAIVSLRVNKSNIKSMCKIEEMLPDGYVFHAIERENADFSSYKNIARFMWLQAPQKNIFFVSYKVIPNPGYSIKDLYINGAFSFIDNGNTYSVVILEKDMRALSESNAKPVFETSLQESYNSNLNSEINQTNSVSTNPKSVNYSSKANYDINSQNITSDLQNNQPQTSNNLQANSQISTTPKPIASNNQSNDYIELSNELKSKNYNQNQIDFFTSTAINTTAQPFTNSPSYSDEVGTNLNQAKSSQIPNSTSTTVNINAIPAPSTYFPNQQYNTDDPDNVSNTLNASYNKNMENAGLIGSNTINETNSNPSQLQNSTPPPVYSQSATPKVTTQGYSTNSNYSVNQKNTISNNEQAVASNSAQTNNVSTKTNSPTNSTSISNNGNKSNSTIQSNTNTNKTQPTISTNNTTNGNQSLNTSSNNSQLTQSQISDFQNNINIPAPSVNQPKTGNYTQNSTLPASNTLNQNITKYPESNNQPVQTLQPKSNNTTPTVNSNQNNTNTTIVKQNLNQTTSGSNIGTSNNQNVNNTKTNTISQNQTNTLPTTVAKTSVTNQPTTTNPNNSNSNNITATNSNKTTTNQNSITTTTPKTTSYSNSQNSQYIAQNQQIKPSNTNQLTNNTNSDVTTNNQNNANNITPSKSSITQDKTSDKYITYNNSKVTTQTIIRDENHNKLTVPEVEKSEPRLSNKDNFSQNETKITQFAEQTGKSNVYFRVQISAGHSMVNTKHYFKKLQIRDNVIVEEIAGWFKYTIQKFESYISARNQRNSIWNETTIKDAFVVAYNGRNRITVQEALMITNQKWVQ